MKKYSYSVRRFREANKKIKFKEEMDALINSNEFIEKFQGYVEDIALFKTVKGRKFMRSTEYAAIGIMDQNDVIQEAYLAFLEAYNNLDWDKVSETHENERGALIWSFLKKSTILNLEYQLRNKKDGVRITQYQTFKDGGVNTNLITTLFSQLEKVFFRNQEDVALTAWETDLTGAFLEVHMDEFLDLKKSGGRNFKGIEREVLKRTYGIDGVKLTQKEISEKYNISHSTIRVIKNRALNKLKKKESKILIAEFLKEYRIKTKANYEEVYEVQQAEAV